MRCPGVSARLFPGRSSPDGSPPSFSDERFFIYIIDSMIITSRLPTARSRSGGAFPNWNAPQFEINWKTFSLLRDINHTVLPPLATESGIEFSTFFCARSDEFRVGADRLSRGDLPSDEQSLSSCRNRCHAICADISTSIRTRAAVLGSRIPAEPRRGERAAGLIAEQARMHARNSVGTRDRSRDRAHVLRPLAAFAPVPVGGYALRQPTLTAVVEIDFGICDPEPFTSSAACAQNNKVSKPVRRRLAPTPTCDPEMCAEN